MIVPSGNQPSIAKLLDLEMLVTTGGCERTEKEFKILLKTSGLKLLLDERGRSMGSRDFAFFLQRILQGGHQNLVFFCGGPFGYDPSLREAADHLISLSPMTFPHELARLLLFEQLYRAMTIINNEPYHY